MIIIVISGESIIITNLFLAASSVHITLRCWFDGSTAVSIDGYFPLNAGICSVTLNRPVLESSGTRFARRTFPPICQGFSAFERYFVRKPCDCIKRFKPIRSYCNRNRKLDIGLQHPQMRSRGNQLIHRRLSKTRQQVRFKESDGYGGWCLELRRGGR